MNSLIGLLSPELVEIISIEMGNSNIFKHQSLKGILAEAQSVAISSEASGSERQSARIWMEDLSSLLNQIEQYDAHISKPLVRIALIGVLEAGYILGGLAQTKDLMKKLNKKRSDSSRKGSLRQIARQKEWQRLARPLLEKQRPLGSPSREFDLGLARWLISEHNRTIPNLPATPLKVVEFIQTLVRDGVLPPGKIDGRSKKRSDVVGVTKSGTGLLTRIPRM